MTNEETERLNAYYRRDAKDLTDAELDDYETLLLKRIAELESIEKGGA